MQGHNWKWLLPVQPNISKIVIVTNMAPALWSAEMSKLTRFNQYPVHLDGSRHSVVVRIRKEKGLVSQGAPLRCDAAVEAGEPFISYQFGIINTVSGRTECTFLEMNQEAIWRSFGQNKVRVLGSFPRRIICFWLLRELFLHHPCPLPIWSLLLSVSTSFLSKSSKLARLPHGCKTKRAVLFKCLRGTSHIWWIHCLHG